MRMVSHTTPTNCNIFNQHQLLFSHCTGVVARSFAAVPHPTAPHAYLVVASISAPTPQLLHGCLRVDPKPSCSNWTVVSGGDDGSDLHDVAVVAGLALGPTAAQALSSDVAWLGVASMPGSATPRPVVLTYAVGAATRLRATWLADDMVGVGGVSVLAGGGGADTLLVAGEGALHVACVLDAPLADVETTGACFFFYGLLFWWWFCAF